MRAKHPGLERARALAQGYRAQLGARPLFAVDAARGSLYLYEQIGENWWSGKGTTAKMVADALAELKAKNIRSLDIFVNSPGGNIFEAKAIYAELRRFDGERKVHVDGIAASAASFIAMAGDTIVTAPAATWMIHDVWAYGAGNAAEMRKLADILELESAAFADVYAKRSKSKLDDVKAWMAAEEWMSAATALERGFTDEISEADADTDDDDESSEDLEAALRNAAQTLSAGRG